MRYEYAIDPQLKDQFLATNQAENPYYIDLGSRKTTYIGFVKAAGVVGLLIGMSYGITTFSLISFIMYSVSFCLYTAAVAAALSCGFYKKSKENVYGKDKHIYNENVSIESNADSDYLIYSFDFNPVNEGKHQCIQRISLKAIRHLFLNPSEHLLVVDGEFVVERSFEGQSTTGFMPSLKIHLNFQDNIPMLETLSKLSGCPFEKVEQGESYWSAGKNLEHTRN